MVPFSASTIIDRLFTSDGTRPQMVHQWENLLIDAGWSLVVGTAGSTDITYESANTPQNFKIRFRCQDMGTPGVKFTLQSPFSASTDTKFLTPINATLWRVWANKYQWTMFKSGTDMGTYSSMVFGGVPWVPDFLADFYRADPNGFGYLGFLHGNDYAGSGGPTSGDLVNLTWRGAASYAGVRNFTFLARNYTLTGTGTTGFLGRCSGNAFGARGVPIQWIDGTWVLEEAILNFPQGAAMTNALASKGLLWDAMLAQRAFDSEVVRMIGSHLFRAYTHQANTSFSYATLMLLTNQAV